MLHRKAVLAMVFSQDDKIIATADAEGCVRVWKFSDGKRLREIETQSGGVGCLVLTSNNSQLIAGCMDKTIRLYGLKSGNLMKHLKGHDSFLQRLELHPQKENILISSALDGNIFMWNLQEADPNHYLISKLEIEKL
jgi:WD40 repeat protein